MPRATSCAFSKSRSPRRLPATRSTPASTCSSRRRSTAFPRTSPGRSSAASFRRSSSAARRFSRRSTATTGSTSARLKSTCRCTATSWTAATRCRRSTASPGWRGLRRRPASMQGRASKGRCSSTRAASSRRARGSALTRCSEGTARSNETRTYRGAIVWADSRIGREAHVTDTIIGRSGQIGRNVQLQRRRAWRHDVHRRIQPPMNPNIFKAYDVRGLYPAELDEQGFHQIGRAFVAYLKAKRIGVGTRHAAVVAKPRRSIHRRRARAGRGRRSTTE